MRLRKDVVFLRKFIHKHSDDWKAKESYKEKCKAYHAALRKCRTDGIKRELTAMASADSQKKYAAWRRMRNYKRTHMPVLQGMRDSGDAGKAAATTGEKAGLFGKYYFDDKSETEPLSEFQQSIE